MSLEKSYPNLIAKITEPVYDIRDLVVVDENYDDVDSDEFDVFEVEEYNFLIYVTERVQAVLGKERLESLISKFETYTKFENFFAAEPDMYGVQSTLGEEEIAHAIVTMIEEELAC